MTQIKPTTVRIEPEIKERASAVFAGLGMSLSTGVEVCLRAVVRSNGLPFDMTLADGEEERK